jgi:hypothetical protein
MVFIPTRVFAFIMILTVSLLVTIFIYLATRGTFQAEIRPIAAIEAIPEAIGRAAELGKAVHYNSGIGGLSGMFAPMTISALKIAGRVAEECGQLGVYMRYTAASAVILPAIQDLVRGGYVKAGRPELYQDDMVYYAPGQKPFMAASMGYIMREKPAVSIMFGATYWETLNVMGASAMVDAMPIGGTARLYYQSFYLAMCDYCTIGEELYAAAAAIDKQPHSVGTLTGTDYAKMICMALAFISAIIVTAGSDAWSILTGL